MVPCKAPMDILYLEACIGMTPATMVCCCGLKALSGDGERIHTSLKSSDSVMFTHSMNIFQLLDHSINKCIGIKRDTCRIHMRLKRLTAIPYIPWSYPSSNRAVLMMSSTSSMVRVNGMSPMIVLQFHVRLAIYYYVTISLFHDGANHLDPSLPHIHSDYLPTYLPAYLPSSWFVVETCTCPTDLFIVGCSPSGSS